MEPTTYSLTYLDDVYISRNFRNENFHNLQAIDKNPTHVTEYLRCAEMNNEQSLNLVVVFVQYQQQLQPDGMDENVDGGDGSE